MNWKITIILILLVLLITTRREPFTEMFGFSGYTKVSDPIRFNDPRPDLSAYQRAEASVNNDTMQKFVLQTNEEIQKRTGLCTYIIETTSLARYKKEDSDLYECVFMAVKNSGFAFGFSVAALFELSGDDIKLVSLRSQPFSSDTPSDVTPFVESRGGQDFVKYELVKEAAVPTQGELEMAKNKLKQM